MLIEEATGRKELESLTAPFRQPEVESKGMAKSMELESEVDMIATKDTEGVIIKLTLPEAQQILEIDLDEDMELALQFIKENMARTVDRCLTPS